MSKNTTYEQIIAQKLEQLPVPDHSDAIWAAIEKQLNVEMPVNNNTPSAPKVAVKPGIIIATAVIIITAIIFIVQMFTTPAAKQPPLKEPVITPPAKKELDSIDIKTDTVQHIQKPDSKTEKNAIILKPVDTTIARQIPEPVSTISFDRKDSIQNKPLIIKTIPVDSVSLPKKNRGVTGIGEDDYRFVPKDSTNN